MQDFQPLVSIIIPVFNGGNYLAEAINSALAQTYENIEIIVVNDGSKDNGATERIALSYGSKIRYFYKENGGVSTALNLGIKNMKGEYFSWLSHDDKYESEKIEKQIRLLAPFSDRKVLALCATKQINKAAKVIGEDKKPFFREKQLIPSNEVIMYLFQYGTFNGCSLLIPKEAFKECGTFDESLRYNQDSFMWLKIFLSGYNLVYQYEKDSLMRIHDGQLTQRGIEIYHRDCEYMSRYLIPEFKKLTDDQNRYLYAYAKYNAKYNTPAVWKACLKEKDSIHFFQRLNIRATACYGKIRPLIRKIYYRLFKKVKTK